MENKKKMRQTLLWFFIAGIILISFAAGYAKKQPNVIIVVWNGVRYAESMGDNSEQYFPFLRKSLLSQGTLYTHMYSSSYEFHTPALAEILSGTSIPQYKYGMDRVLPEHPTIFQYARKANKDSITKYWEIGSYGPHTCFSMAKDYAEDTRPCCMLSSLFPFSRDMDIMLCKQAKAMLSPEEKFFFKETSTNWHRDMWDALGEVSYRFFKKVLKKYRPRLIVLTLTQADIAHGAHWAKYISALRRLDEITEEIFRIINRDPFYKDNTYLIVTPDHGRNRYFMQHTGENESGSAQVWAYLYGPDIKKNQIVDRPVFHADICPTVALVMNVEASQSQGNLLEEAFEHIALRQGLVDSQ